MNLELDLAIHCGCSKRAIKPPVYSGKPVYPVSQIPSSQVWAWYRLFAEVYFLDVVYMLAYSVI
jgi:hypothetical protein